MALRTAVIVLASTALMITPAVATAQNSLPISASQPTAEQAEGSKLRSRGFIIPLSILVAIVLSIVLLTAANDESKDSRASP